MTRKKQSNFNFPDLRRRAKKALRKKHKKTIKLSDVDKVWLEFVEYGIVRPLLKYGVVYVDERFKIEIAGKRVVNNNSTYALMSRGLAVRKDGAIKKIENINDSRAGVVYRIKVTDTNYKKGQLIFKAETKLSQRVHKQLITTKQYYKIEP